MTQNIYIIQQYGGYNETREENPVKGKKVEFTITQSGITTITARVGIGNYSSSQIKKQIKLDNIKPEITKITLAPTPRKSR